MAKPSSNLPLPPLPGKPGGLGRKIELTVERAIVWLHNHVAEPVSDWIAWAGETFAHSLRAGALRVFGPFLTWYSNLEGQPPEIKALIDDALAEEGQFGAAALGLIGSAAGSGVIGSITGSLMAPVTYMINRLLRPARVDPSVAWPMIWRNPLATAELREHLADKGWSENLINDWATILQPRLGPAELFSHQFLTEGNAVDTATELGRLGYSADNVAKLHTIAKMVPGAGDLVRMAVREAWRDDIAAKWGYDQDRPGEFVEWMHKQGDLDGWAEKYWRAHWELPGITLGMELLHRVPEFDLDDFKELLKISDIPSAFRDYIGQVAYRTLTRVDVRRMHATGVLSRDQVKRSYLDFGYNDRDAELMTEFTVRYNTENERELTKADILGGFRDGMLSQSDAIALLVSIGYPQEIAVFHVGRELAKIERARVNEQVKYIKTLYINQEITRPEAASRLGALGLPVGEVEQKLNEWDIARTSKVERPSRATLDKLFRKDIITQTEYTTGLDGLGYSTKYINWYLDSVLEEKTEAARKEEEAARKEQEALVLRTVKSAYQIAKANIDVDITELQTAIAETQMALRARSLRYERELDLARRITSITKLKEQSATDIAALRTEIKVLDVTLAGVSESIANIEEQIADVKLRSTPAPRKLSPGERAMAIRDREVTIAELRETIDLAQTEIKAIELAIVEAAEGFDLDAAAVGIAERKLLIETIQDDIAAIVVEIAEIKATLAVIVIEIPPDVAAVQIKELELAIKIGLKDIGAIKAEMALLHHAVTARKARLAEELDLAERAVAIETVEAEYLEDLATLTERLNTLRVNVAELREAKATLTFEYREVTAP